MPLAMPCTASACSLAGLSLPMPAFEDHDAERRAARGSFESHVRPWVPPYAAGAGRPGSPQSMVCAKSGRRAGSPGGRAASRQTQLPAPRALGLGGAGCPRQGGTGVERFAVLPKHRNLPLLPLAEDRLELRPLDLDEGAAEGGGQGTCVSWSSSSACEPLAVKVVSWLVALTTLACVR